MEPAAPAAKPAASPAAAGTDRRLELRDRLAVTILLVPFVLLVVQAGGILFLLALLFMWSMAALEFAWLFAGAGQRPAVWLLVGGVILLVAAEQYPVLNPLGLVPAALVIAALTWHLVDYERGTAPLAGTDFAITLAGIFYLGWLGRYFVSLRALPDGLWWLLTILPSVWLADTGAYAFGRAFGRRFFRSPMAPRLSPKKTWEGYVGSVIFGALGGGILALSFTVALGPASLLNWRSGALVGGLVGLFGPLGDLGVSMIKRQMGVKDSGALLAGHGGALDRVDSWLVAGAVGYYFVRLLASLAAS
ncbi:MAG: phosphatidate cytidylyltransferase [Anaerolineales bacterium]